MFDKVRWSTTSAGIFNLSYASWGLNFAQNDKDELFW